MSLLTEQRTAKIIGLLEELRRDMPSVHNRLDLEAEALTKTVDPHEVLATFESKMEETLEVLGTPNSEASEEGARLVTEQIDAAATEAHEGIERARQSVSQGGCRASSPPSFSASIVASILTQ